MPQCRYMFLTCSPSVCMGPLQVSWLPPTVWRHGRLAECRRPGDRKLMDGCDRIQHRDHQFNIHCSYWDGRCGGAVVSVGPSQQEVLCGVCRFALCLREFSPCSLASSHRPKISLCGELETLNCMCGCKWLFVFLCGPEMNLSRVYPPQPWVQDEMGMENGRMELPWLSTWVGFLFLFKGFVMCIWTSS